MRAVSGQASRGQSPVDRPWSKIASLSVRFKEKKAFEPIGDSAGAVILDCAQEPV
jgi:hypothetical protein